MIKFENLTFAYENSDVPVLRRINLEIEPGHILLVSGATGSGKSTFLKTFNGLAPHFTGGSISGKLFIEGHDVIGLLPHDLAEKVGYVNQQPEAAFATDTVEEELVFGLEQLGWDESAMHTRVQELTELFDLQDLIQRPLAQLSGGQQQRVAIASAIAARQQLLVLDEPTSALDSQSAAHLLEILKDLASLHGITIVIAEHRFERVLPIVDTVLLIHDDGSIKEVTPDKSNKKSDRQPILTHAPLGDVVISAQGLSKKFGTRVALEPIDLNLRSGSVTAVTGDNGSGKTSLLWEAFRSAKAQGISVAMVPQNAADLLFLSTLAEELAEADAVSSNAKTSTSSRLESFVGRLNPSGHPRDLSAGQQLALVLAIQLGTDARIVIVDEPTRGLDLKAKQSLASLLLELRDQGNAILVASHDSDFIAAISTRRMTLRNGRKLADSDEN